MSLVKLMEHVNVSEHWNENELGGSNITSRKYGSSEEILSIIIREVSSINIDNTSYFLSGHAFYNLRKLNFPSIIRNDSTISQIKESSES